MKGYFTVFLLFIFFCSDLMPQHSFPREADSKSNPSKSITIPNETGHIYNLTRTWDSRNRLDDINPMENLDVIVEFKTEPLFLAKNTTRRGLSKSAYSSQFSTFRNDLIKLYGSYTKHFGITASVPEIKNEFYRIFNAVSISLPGAVVNSLYSLPYVKKVYPDKKVSALLKESVPLIKADSLWLQYGTGGDSIVIGILDTGIDYMHPALGGGIGKGFKVIGGYDCYYGDDDPMDDNGHGTHVAGIAAADGELKGVAPKANLMAIKVLSRNAGGTESNVIKGLERAIDPNQDDNPDDMIDIANLSLGGAGYPEDALSRAVNNAVKLGIICCVAAGNSGGHGTFCTISSPGTAELAITTGASDKFDKLEPMSSRGPNKSNSFIKPEILAPGVNILSVCMGDGYVYNTGTSMAAPHAAGACALLKSLHPKWTPMEIKSALMSTAKDLEEEVMSQGAGRIDVLSAAKVSTLFNPCHLSFGLDNLKKDTWKMSDTILVKNVSDGMRNYKFSYSGKFPGMQIDAIPSEFSLAPGASLEVIFRLEVNNKVLPEPWSSSQSFSGNIFVHTNSGILHFPWAFEKASRLVINFDAMGTRFVLTNSKVSYGSDNAIWKGSSAEMIVPPGTYDLLTLYSAESDTLRIIASENMLLMGSDTINISPADAKNKIILSVKDKIGNNFEGENSTWIYQIAFPASSATKDMTIFSSRKKFFKCSDISDRFRINIGGVIASSDNRVCVADFNIHGIRGFQSLTNDYSDLIEENVSLDIPLNIRQPEVFFIGGLKMIDEYSVTFGGNYLESYMPEGRKWSGKVYLPSHSVKHYNFEPATAISIADSRTSALRKSTSDISEVSFAIDLPPFSVNNGSVGLFTAQMPSKDIFLSPSGGTISLKNWLIYPNAYHNNNSGMGPSILPEPNFFGQMQEVYLNLSDKVVYKIFDENNLLVQDLLKNAHMTEVQKKKYRTEFSNIPYYIEGYEAYAVMNCTFDLSLSDPNPPLLKSLQIRNSRGIPESRLDKGEKATVFLAGCDYLLDQDYRPYRMPVVDDSTRILVRQHGETDWKKLNAVKILQDSLIGSYYSADISSMTDYDSTALDLKVIMFDLNHNSTECSFEPAVGIGKFRGTSTIDEISPGVTDPDVTSPGEYALSSNYPNPFNPSTTLSFTLPEESYLTVEIFDIIGRKVTTLADEKRKAGKYSLQWHADTYSSGIYFCRFRAQGTRNFEKTVKMVLLR
ncbi:MAG: S8 family serine peptidase [Syntrophomonadaceae bacterium]